MNEMRSINQLWATDGEIRAVATNPSCSPPTGTRIRSVMNPRKLDEAEAMGHGVFQVMVLLAPYLQGDARLLFEKLASGIVNKVRTNDDDDVPLVARTQSYADCPIPGGRGCMPLRPRPYRPSSFVLRPVFQRKKHHGNQKGGWTAFPHDNSAFVYDGAALKKNWARLHRAMLSRSLLTRRWRSVASISRR